MTQRSPIKLVATACAFAAGLTLLAPPSSGTAASRSSAAPITARLSAASTTPALFGRVLRYTVARAGQASISLERRRGFYWRPVVTPSVVRFAAGPGQRRLGLLFPRLSPSPGLYHVVLRAGTTVLRLPLDVS